MKLISAGIAGLTALILVSPAQSQGADKSVGQREYESKCISCHGAAGRGDGWLSKFLMQRPATLTGLKRGNGGVFPFDRVYEVIDGRREVLQHGPRSMPVWGGVYRVESEKAYDPFIGQYYADEGMIRARILALIDYLSQLQD